MIAAAHPDRDVAITLEWLKGKRVRCEEPLREFERLFPKGASARAVFRALLRSGHKSAPLWRGWWAAHGPGLTAKEREELCAVSDFPRSRREETALYANNLTLKERENFFIRVVDNLLGLKFARDRMAAHAIGLTYAQRKRLCEKSSDPVFWYRVAAAKAPGLTFLQRVAFCRRSAALASACSHG